MATFSSGAGFSTSKRSLFIEFLFFIWVIWKPFLSFFVWSFRELLGVPFYDDTMLLLRADRFGLNSSLTGLRVLFWPLSCCFFFLPPSSTTPPCAFSLISARILMSYGLLRTSLTSSMLSSSPPSPRALLSPSSEASPVNSCRWRPAVFFAPPEVLPPFW